MRVTNVATSLILFECNEANPITGRPKIHYERIIQLRNGNGNEITLTPQEVDILQMYFLSPVYLNSMNLQLE